MTRKPSTQSSTPRTVLLRLSRGVSTHVTWLLRSSPSAATVTLGSDASCDWQMHGRDIPGHALSVALFDGGLFVASGPNAEVWLDGQALPEVWQRVDRASSIEIGEAQLDLFWQSQEQESDTSCEHERPTFPDGFARPLDGAVAQRSATTARNSWGERPSRTSWLDTPSLLGRVAESRPSSQILRYAGLVLFTALAYRAWLLLLDRI